MNILSDFKKDIRTQKQIPGSYEWWYFDAQSVDDYSIVIIFYEGNPFSKRYIQGISSKINQRAEYYPAISISVYKKGKPIFYAFEEMLPGVCNFSETEPAGTAGGNRFKGKISDGKLLYDVILDHKLENGDRVEASLKFTSDVNEISLTGKNMEVSPAHLWNLVQPQAHVTGSISLSGYRDETIHFSGKGYHDHNFGTEPMKETFDEWYWGRYHFDEMTLVYYLMNENNNWQKKAWLIDNLGSVVTIDSNGIQLSGSQISLFGLISSRSIEFKQTDFNAHLQLDRVTDNGPFYQRFEGRVLATYNDKPHQARGISEYIKPNRIYNKLYWPLVDMRIKYPGKTHWVQKSPRLFRWTW